MEENSPAPRAYRPLRTDVAAVTFVTEGCLPVRSPLSDCASCAEACPVGALTVGWRGPSLADGCLHCGRCAAACPTGAIRVAGFPRLALPDLQAARAEDGPLEVDCWRVPRERSPAGALRVPCLGGLDAGTLAALHARHPAGVVLLDRGWCGGCPAGGRPPLQEEAVTAAAGALVAAGADPEHAPRIEHRPLPGQSARPEIPDAMAERAVSRRGLFRHLAGRAAATAEQWQDGAGEGPAPGGLAQPLRALPRERLVAALRRITSAGIPAEASPAARMNSDLCANHRICASLCPTGALRGVEDGDGAGLDFDPATCIGCELCSRVCPEGALQIGRAGGQSVLHPLTRHSVARCSDCGRPFTAGEGRDRCPNCRKDQELLTGGVYEALFGHPPEAVGSGTPAGTAAPGPQKAFHANMSRGKEAFHDRRS